MSRSAPLRRLTSLLALALVALLAFAGTAAAKKCYPRGIKTIVVNSKLRVYKRGANVYACVLSTGRLKKLSGARRSSDPADARLSSHVSIYGYYAAWTTRSIEDDGLSPFTNVVHGLNIRTGQTPAGLPYQSNSYIRDIVVLASGATAWAVFDDDSSYIEGFDRANHDPDLLSDDQKSLPARPGLHSLTSKTVGWSYSDGTKGTASLFF